jgi:SAM-dependent methyltransferase
MHSRSRKQSPERATSVLMNLQSAVFLVCAMASALFVAGCPSRNKENRAGDSRARAAASGASAAVSGSVGQATSLSGPAPVHDPARAPIKCPLRKQGVNVAHLRPFEEVEDYIAHLERADRAQWQKPDEVVAELGLKGTETVVDLGAGSGYFTFRFARALPKGKVVAADTEPEMVRHIHHKAMTQGVENVQARLIDPEDPDIPAKVDLVFVCDVLHHVSDRPGWLRKLASQMHSGARLALIEFKTGRLPEGPPEGMKIPRKRLVALATEAGLVLGHERKDLLPYQVFLVFRKP